MSYPEGEIIEAARDAWGRLQANARTSWSDWLLIGRALMVARRDCMLEAKANSPLGWRYNQAMGKWLRANGLHEISGQDRYQLFKCLELECEIETWRAGLTEVQRCRWNHPNSILLHLNRRDPQPRRRVESRKAASKVHKPHKSRPIYWSQDILRAAAEGIRMANSNDIYKVALAALNAAFPTRDSLIEAADEPRPHTRADRIAQLEAANA